MIERPSVREELAPWAGDCGRSLAFAAVTVFLAGFATAGPASAAVTLEGDATSLTVVADQVSRREIVAALAEKFDFATVGVEVEDSPISGRFSGTLGYVLKSILPRNGYAIAYTGGRPVRVTFSDNGAATPYQMQPVAAAPFLAEPPMDMAAVPPPPPPPPGGYMEMQAQAAMTGGMTDGGTPPPMQEQPGNGQTGVGGDDMQQQIAESTARALAQLKQLTTDLKKAGP